MAADTNASQCHHQQQLTSVMSADDEDEDERVTDGELWNTCADDDMATVCGLSLDNDDDDDLNTTSVVEPLMIE